jgi:hypothetical protein
LYHSFQTLDRKENGGGERIRCAFASVKLFCCIMATTQFCLRMSTGSVVLNKYGLRSGSKPALLQRKRLLGRWFGLGSQEMYGLSLAR